MSEREQPSRFARSRNWYDLTLQKDGFVRRFVGRLETTSPGVSDPAMHTG